MGIICMYMYVYVFIRIFYDLFHYSKPKKDINNMLKKLETCRKPVGNLLETRKSWGTIIYYTILKITCYLLDSFGDCYMSDLVYWRICRMWDVGVTAEVIVAGCGVWSGAIWLSGNSCSFYPCLQWDRVGQCRASWVSWDILWMGWKLLNDVGSTNLHRIWIYFLGVSWVIGVPPVIIHF